MGVRVGMVFYIDFDIFHNHNDTMWYHTNHLEYNTLQLDMIHYQLAIRIVPVGTDLNIDFGIYQHHNSLMCFQTNKSNYNTLL